MPFAFTSVAKVRKMKLSRHVMESKRLQLAAIAGIIAVWVSCYVGGTDDPNRSAFARSSAELESSGVNDAALANDAAPAGDSSQPEWQSGRDLGTSTSGGHSNDHHSMSSGSRPPPGAPNHSTQGCATIPSTYRQRSIFSENELNRWSVNRGASQPGTSFTFTKRGPASNPSLCAAGCALLAFTIPAGEGWGGGAIVDEWFDTTTNLYGSTIVAQVALELPRAHLPVNVRLYTQGDELSGYAWGTSASRPTSILSDLSSFHDILLRPVDRRSPRPFCAAAAGAIGIQVQRSRISLVDIPVKLYVNSVEVGSDAGGKEQSLAIGGSESENAPSSDPVSSSVATLDPFGKDGYCQLAANGAISIAADDWVAAGTCQGYGYTYVIGRRKDTKVVPACDAVRCSPALSRISSTGLCASGTVAADPNWNSKVGVGFDFDPSKKSTSGLALGYRMSGTSILRFQIEDPKGNYYCVDLEETDEEGSLIYIPWNYFSTRCWDRWDPGTSFSQYWPIRGMQLVASCRADKNSWFDMCVTSLATF